MQLLLLHRADFQHVGQDIWVNAAHIVTLEKHYFPKGKAATRITLNATLPWSEDGCLYVEEEIKEIAGIILGEEIV